MALAGQTPRADSLAVLAIADSALAAISRNDFVAFTDLILEGTSIVSIAETLEGRRIRVRMRETDRAGETADRLAERGFRGEARVEGPIAMVWLPYDFHVNGKWSHCGVDIFTMVRGDTGWQIAALVYSILQPPACAPHPDGPLK